MSQGSGKEQLILIASQERTIKQMEWYSHDMTASTTEAVIDNAKDNISKHQREIQELEVELENERRAP